MARNLVQVLFKDLASRHWATQMYVGVEHKGALSWASVAGYRTAFAGLAWKAGSYSFVCLEASWLGIGGLLLCSNDS